jgi:hypothetical protein
LPALPALPALFTRPSPARSGTARVSCRGSSVACR